MNTAPPLGPAYTSGNDRRIGRLGHVVCATVGLRQLRVRRGNRDRFGFVIISRFEAVELLDGVDNFRDVQKSVALEADVNKG
ncbi:MAG: hypothetical protein LC804_01675 [Acidobacteria bacterium]|nr:hypothetical protein [Acidobacteriota bacterium]